MKTISPILLILLCLAACNPFDTKPKQQINATAARIKAVVDSIAGPYKIVVFQIDGKDYMDTLRKYGNINTCIYSFSSYNDNLWPPKFEPNVIPDKFRGYVGIKSEISYNDTLNSTISFGNYRFKNFKNYDRFDSLEFDNPRGIFFILKKNGRIIDSFVPPFLSVLKSCNINLKGDSLILGNAYLKAKIIFHQVPNDYIQ